MPCYKDAHSVPPLPDGVVRCGLRPPTLADAIPVGIPQGRMVEEHGGAQVALEQTITNPADHPSGADPLEGHRA